MRPRHKIPQRGICSVIERVLPVIRKHIRDHAVMDILRKGRKNFPGIRKPPGGQCQPGKAIMVSLPQSVNHGRPARIVISPVESRRARNWSAATTSVLAKHHRHIPPVVLRNHNIPVRVRFRLLRYLPAGGKTQGCPVPGGRCKAGKSLYCCVPEV